MAGITFLKSDILSLIDHHIALLDRFELKGEAPFSIIYFYLNDRYKQSNAEIFKRILRKTDALFNDGEDFIVMLPGTDWNGAMELLRGIQEFLSQEEQDNVVTYPDDGEDSVTLLEKLHHTVKKNSQREISLIS